MPNQDQVCNTLRQFILLKGWICNETDEGTTKRFDVQQGQKTAIAKVHSTGTLQIQGALSEPSLLLMGLRDLIDEAQNPSEIILLMQIDSQIVEVGKQITGFDPIVLQLFREAIICLKVNAVAGAAILLGCASERSIRVLIEVYTNAISEPKNRDRFRREISAKSIFRAYEHLKHSIRSSKNQSAVDNLVRDWVAQIDALFTFYRVCRNDIGHPVCPPDVGRVAVAANLAQFVMYIQVIYRLIAYFSVTEVIL